MDIIYEQLKQKCYATLSYQKSLILALCHLVEFLLEKQYFSKYIINVFSRFLLDLTMSHGRVVILRVVFGFRMLLKENPWLKKKSRVGKILLVLCSFVFCLF